MESDFQDFINRLPDPILSHILSFLTTKEAASTSLLSKRWRYLLAFVPNLVFDDSVYLHPERRVKNPLEAIPELWCFRIVVDGKLKKLSTSFPDFVDRILHLQGQYPVNNFFLKLVDSKDPVDPDCVTPWIHNVLDRGVKNLQLVVNNWDLSNLWLPPRIFLSDTLISLALTIYNPAVKIGNVHLPKLKLLHLEPVNFSEDAIGFNKLLSGCPVLEELVMDDILSRQWDSFSLSITTLKRLTFRCPHPERDDEGYVVSFDTPNLVYLEYTEVAADMYPIVKFDSLVEAKIDLLKPVNEFAEDDEEEVDAMLGDVTSFVKGISNVQRLYLSANTLEVLTFCCAAIPVFGKLSHLTIQSKAKVGWESLPELLKNCPNLETLVFQGLCHKATDKCGDVCLCSREDAPSSLVSSSVQVLKIHINDGKIEQHLEQVKHFLETMPHLEEVVLYYDPSFNQDVKVSSQVLTEVASPKCKVNLVSETFVGPESFLEESNS